MADSLWQGVLLCLFGYVVGSIPFAILISKTMRLSDPRSYGSMNPGATNVLRSGNKKAAALTLIGDCLKGWFVVWISHFFVDGAWLAAIAFATFFGHIYSLFLKFKGGKGVATSLGVLIGLSPWLGLGLAATWLVVFALSKYSSLAALVSAFSAPIWSYFLLPVSQWGWIILMVVFLIYRHKNNLKKLLSGKEDKMQA
jgi:glycerol-3-phosphate acyltransferase PlsY